MVSVISLLAVILALAILATFWIRRIPMVMGITIANFGVFLIQIGTGTGFTIQGSPLTEDLAARVAYIADGDVLRWYTFVTATLLHGGILHIVGNMLVLLMIGLPFEERVGRARFLAFYVFTAFWAVLLHALWIYYTGTPRDLLVPIVGASGAVFGILGAFATMYPRDEVPMFLIFILLPRVPVYVAAVVLMLFEGFLLFGGATRGIAHAAHLGGAVGGFLLALLLRPKGPPDRGPQPRRLDYEVLDRLAPDDGARDLVRKLRENEDQAETQQAWFERLLPRLRCHPCGEPLEDRRAGRLVCPRGHEHRYAR